MILPRNRIPQLASRFNVTKEAILAARDLIRSLNPKPGTAFSEAGPVEFLHEDAFVKTTEKGLKSPCQHPMAGRLSSTRDICRS